MFYYYSVCSLSVILQSLEPSISLSNTSLLSLLLLFLFSLNFFFSEESSDTSVLSSILSSSLFTFPLFFFQFFFMLCFTVLFFLFFCSLLSSLLYVSPILTVISLFYILNHLFLFIHLFLFLFFFCFIGYTVYTVSAVWHSITYSVVSSLSITYRTFHVFFSWIVLFHSPHICSLIFIMSFMTLFNVIIQCHVFISLPLFFSYCS